MISEKDFRALCLAIPGAEEKPHFEKSSFRIRGKIFATYDASKHTATIKLDAVQQDLFSLHDRNAVYGVSNKWGQQGWTIFDLALVRKNVLSDAVSYAAELVSGKR